MRGKRNAAARCNTCPLHQPDDPIDGYIHWLLFLEYISSKIDMGTIEKYGKGISTAMDLWELEQARRDVQAELQKNNEKPPKGR